MRSRVAICIGWVVIMLCGLVLVPGCQSVGDEPAVAAPSEATPSEETPVINETTAEDAVEPKTSETSIELALRFAPERTTRFKVTTQTDRRIKWEGSTAKKPAQFKGGNTGRTVELTFAQQVERVDADGRAVLKITIEGLTYQGVSQGRVALDFDSTRQKDQDSGLASLIGQSYKLEITPKGEVLALIDMEPARRATEGATAAHRTAEKLLSDQVVRKRHQIACLSAREAETANLQDSWSKEVRFAFGMLGAKVYERVYTLESIEKTSGGEQAVVVMKAIPSASGASAAHEGPAASPLVSMFDSTERYEGELRFDLDAGQVGEYAERLETEWVTADPAAVQSGDANPAVLRMSAIESYRLERVE